jgi:hypothetical protein
VNRVEEPFLLFGLADVLLNNQRIRLRVNVLHCHLEAIESSCLGDLDLCGELSTDVFIYDSIRSSKKSKNMFYEVLLWPCEAFPILAVLREVNLFGGPEGGFVFLVHFPYARVLNGEHDPSARVFNEEWIDHFFLLKL